MFAFVNLELDVCVNISAVYMLKCVNIPVVYMLKCVSIPAVSASFAASIIS
jgi:hypothetical protein